MPATPRERWPLPTDRISGDGRDHDASPLPRASPAMAAGVPDHVWDATDIAALVEAAEAKPMKRGPYEKRASLQERSAP